MVEEDWRGRWAEGRIGWHEPEGNAGLHAAWPPLSDDIRVLVPLCGKSPDLLWLAKRGHDVTGIELSEIAVRDFFAENTIEYQLVKGDCLDRYSAVDLSLTLYCGDYFEFSESGFDALYDRGALVALPPDLRVRYIEHTKNLLRPGASKMIVTLEYDQAVVSGPPFSVPAGEISGYWDDLICVSKKDDIDNCPPKFRAAGLTDVQELVWFSA
jgi:thiopurine S-methyltransferase